MTESIPIGDREGQTENKTVTLSVYPSQPLMVILLFNGYVFGWWLEVGKRVEMLGTIRAEFLLGVFLLLMALWSFLSNTSGYRGMGGKLTRSILIYQAVLLLSLPLSISFDRSWDIYINKNIKFALMCFFISQFVTSPRHLAWYLISSLAAFLKVGQEALLGKMTGSMVWENQGVPRLHGTQGTMFGHPNALSGKFVSILPFSWYLFPIVRSRILKWLVVLQVLFSINIIVFTGSRTGYLAVLVLFLMLLFRSGKKMKMLVFLILAAMVTVSYMPDQYKERFKTSFTGKEKEGRSRDARITLFKDSITVFTQNPLGVGISCFIMAQQRAGRRAQDTHNIYTQLLSETGIQGFLAFMWFIYCLLGMLQYLKNGYQQCLETLSALPPGEFSNLPIVTEERHTLLFLEKVTDGLYLFVSIRLVLGLFGHDLFEIYWWMASGMALSLSGMLAVARQRMQEIGEIQTC